MEIILTGITLLMFFTQALSQTNNGDIRLAGPNSNSSQGRIEVYYNGAWGTVCDDGFTNKEAIVVCRQIGSSNPSSAVVAPASVFGTGTGNILIDDVDCLGTETRLEFCRFAGWGVSNCGHDEDVGVICPVTQVTAAPTLTTAPTFPPAPALALLVFDPGNCSTPDPNIRLVGPSHLAGVGVVQLRQNNSWGGVCDDDWDLMDARVVCRMLCFDPDKALPGSVAFDTSNITEPMTVNNVACTGDEASITDCPQSTWATGACTRNEQARVTCVDLDNSPPMRPQPLLDCSHGLITASFSRSRDPYLEEKHLSVALTYTGPCNVVLNTDTNYVSIGVPFDECGTNRTSNTTHIIYTTIIKYLPTYTSGDITNTNTYMVHVTCELPRDPQADRPIQPLTESVTQSAPGEFIVNMHFYRNNSFVTADTQYPLEILLGEWLFVALDLLEVDRNLRLVVPDCFATPSTNRNDTVRYPLFTDKCIDDHTVGFFPLNDTWFGYRYQTFKFVQYSLVYIHCNAYICAKDDPMPECDRSCFSTTTTATSGKRRKRGVSMAPQLVQVSSPSIIVYDRKEPEIIRPTQFPPESTTVRTTTAVLEPVVNNSSVSPAQTTMSETSSSHVPSRQAVASSSHMPTSRSQTSSSVVPSSQSKTSSSHATSSSDHVTMMKSENSPTAASVQNIYFVESGCCSVYSSFSLFVLFQFLLVILCS